MQVLAQRRQQGRRAWPGVVLLAVVFSVLLAMPVHAAAVARTGVSVSVQDTSGNPIEGASIAVYDIETDDQVADGLTAADGTLDLDVPAGEYDVTASMEHYTGASKGVTVASLQMTDVAFELEPYSLAVTGQVTNGKDALEGVGVVAYRFDSVMDEWQDVGYAMTDATGEYEIWLEPGTPSGSFVIGTQRFYFDSMYYHRWFYADPDVVGDFSSAGSVMWDGVSTTGAIDMAISGESASATVRLVDGNGDPINVTDTGLDFNVYDAADPDAYLEPWIAAGAQAADGYVNIYGLNGGSYNLKVYGDGVWASQWFDGAKTQADAVDFSAGPGANYNDLGDWEMVPSVVSITGTVSGPTGPRPWADVELFRRYPDDPNWHELDSINADDSGVYKFMDLEPGEYRVGTPAVRVGDYGLAAAVFYAGASTLADATSVALDEATPLRDHIDLVQGEAVSVVADSFEDDDAFGQAKPIVANAAAQEHTFYPLEDADWVSLDVVAGTTYRIATMPSESAPAWEGLVDTYLRLYDSDGVSVIDSDDDSGPGWYSFIEWTPTQSKTVYINATELNGESGAYQLVVSSAVHAVVATIDSAGPNPAVAGSPVSFAGHASDTLDHGIMAYRWAEGATVLSSEASFSTSALSVGTHTISFSAQCDDGTWSALATAIVTVNAPAPLGPLPCSVSVPKVSGKATAKKGTTLVGSVAPGHGTSVKLEVQVLSKKKYKKYKTYLAAADGAGAFRYKAKIKKGTYRVRAIVDANGTYVGATSGWRKITVK